jgi:hypothetical protein
LLANKKTLCIFRFRDIENVAHAKRNNSAINPDYQFYESPGSEPITRA